MSLSEFELISKYFCEPSLSRPDVSLSIGDDAAIINIPTGQQLNTVLIQWLEGEDYSKEESGFNTGKSLLQRALKDFDSSDIPPGWMTLSLSMQSSSNEWLSQFSQGLFSVAKENNIQLIGGDTTCGPGGLRLHLMGLQKINS